ncbi:MAG: hypothetical protein AABX29_08565 [Nanoarchaeota archaeon]
MTEMPEATVESVEGPPLDEKSKIHQQIYKDFYLSFKHSQGDEALQKNLFIFLSNYYLTSYSPEQIGTLEEIKDSLIKKADSLKVPASHTRIVALQVRATASKMLNWYLRSLEDRYLKVEMPKKLVSNIANSIIDRDLMYIDPVNERNRPNRKEGQDRKESFFRTYVIEAKPTNSTAFDSMYESIRESFKVGEIPVKGDLRKLQKAWEKTHAGQSFVPKAA